MERDLCNKCFLGDKLGNHSGDFKTSSRTVQKAAVVDPVVDSVESVENLGNASHDEATKQKEMLAIELKCLQEELKQIRDDRDHQLGQVQALTGEVAKYKEDTREARAEVDTLTNKINALEMADFETRTMLEDQKRIIAELRERLAEKEFQVIEGENLRKKLHNMIMELKGNIRVFCRIRPLLPDDGPATDLVVSYPTSTEALGRGIELVQSGICRSFFPLFSGATTSLCAYSMIIISSFKNKQGRSILLHSTWYLITRLLRKMFLQRYHS